MNSKFLISVALFLLSATAYAQPACNQPAGEIPNFSGPFQQINPSTFTNISNDNNYQVGEVFRYANAVSAFGYHADIKIEAISNATITNFDNNAAGVQQRFQPQITPNPTNMTNNQEGYIEYSITFRNTANLVVSLSSLRFRHFDIDGSARGTGYFRETGWVVAPAANIYFNSPSNLTNAGAFIEGSTTWRKILGELLEHAGVSSDPDVFFTVTYSSVSSVRFRMGYKFVKGDGGNLNQGAREYSAEFGCFGLLNQIPLPVSFKSFSATRIKSKVSVKWETATESNNRGFNVQRNINGTWETVAFVFSAATGGNSSSELAYSFNDANTNKGVSQYRIQQVDIDGKAKLSEIRSVKGETMETKLLIYPNPSTTGKIAVVFDDQSLKNVQMSDMSGRIVRSIRNVSNNVNIEGLESGVYSIQVTDLSTSAVSVEKVIIKKR